MKITLTSSDWRPGEITVSGTRQAIAADSAAGPVTLVYERGNFRNYRFLGVQRSRPHPDAQFAGDLAPIVEHLPWDAVPRRQWQRAMAEEQDRRSHYA